MLSVGCVGVQCEWAVGQLGDAPAEARRLAFDATFAFLMQALCAQAADARTQRRIGDQPAFSPGDQPGFRVFGRIQ